MGLRGALTTIVFLHGLHGPEDGFAYPQLGATTIERCASTAGAAAAHDGGVADGGLMFVEGEPLLADVAAMCASTDADVMGGSTSLSGRFRGLNQSLNDRASSLPMYAISTSRPSILRLPLSATCTL